MASIKYRPDIDGLRALAVLAVTLYHFNLLPSMSGGFVGVDIFYAISGFLITSIIERQLEARTFALRGFYVARIRRLAPSLLATLALVITAGLVLLFPADLISLAKELLAAQTYTANIFYWRTVNYFGLQANSAFLLHTWSLAVEEQFYLLYPLFLVMAFRLPRRAVIALVVTAMMGSFLLNLIFVTWKPEATFYLLPTRAWELLAGATAALLMPRQSLRVPLAQCISIAGISLITVSLFAFRPDFEFPGTYALLPTLGAVLILYAGPSAALTFLSARPAVYVGKISYPLYLVHWPIAVFAERILSGAYTTLWRTASLAFSIALSMLLFHLVEQPVRANVVLFAPKRLVRGYFAGLAATLGVVALIFTTNGLPARFPAEAIRLASYADRREPDHQNCEFRTDHVIGADDFCKIGSSTTMPAWLVFGDSHAWATFKIFDGWLSKHGESGLLMFQHSCTPLQGIYLLHDLGRCHAFNARIAEFVATHRDIKNVVLVSFWRAAVEGGLSQSQDVALSKEKSLGLFDKSFANTVHSFHDMGKNVYIWEPVPGAKMPVPTAMAEMALGRAARKTDFTTDEYFRTYSRFFADLRSNKAEITGTFSPSKALCTAGDCQTVISGNPAYFDNNHVATGAESFWIGVLDNPVH